MSVSKSMSISKMYQVMFLRSNKKALVRSQEKGGFLQHFEGTQACFMIQHKGLLYKGVLTLYALQARQSVKSNQLRLLPFLSECGGLIFP